MPLPWLVNAWIEEIMPRRLKNWGYSDVIGFLKTKGFGFYGYKKGSHEAWIGNINGKEVIVEVNFIEGGKSYNLRTLETMIRQSTIDKKEWINWTSR